MSAPKWRFRTILDIDYSMWGIGILTIYEPGSFELGIHVGPLLILTRLYRDER